jgi:hypothetical protein
MKTPIRTYKGRAALVILSGAKDPEEANPATTLRTFQPTPLPPPPLPLLLPGAPFMGLRMSGESRGGAIRSLPRPEARHLDRRRRKRRRSGETPVFRSCLSFLSSPKSLP